MSESSHVIPTDLGKRREHPTMIPGDDAACFLLQREQANVELIARFTIDGEPQSKARARHTKDGGTYSPEANRAAEEVIGWKFRQAAKGHKLDPHATYGVFAIFFAWKRQRRDVDNMLKLVLDGLNKVAWPDDSQVTEISGRKCLVPKGGERTEVAIYRIGMASQQTKACEYCGKGYQVYDSNADAKRFCSQPCNYAWRKECRLRPCGQCGKEFEATNGASSKYCSQDCFSAARRATVTCDGCGIEFTKQRCHVWKRNYCTKECREAKWREYNKRAGEGTCESCGGRTSKKTYKQCRTCRQGKGDPMGKPRIVGGNP